MKGGFLDSITSTLSGWGSSAKKSLGFGDSSAATTSSSTVTPSYDTTSSTTTSSSTGGKNKTRRMRGGYKDNTPTTGLASHSASFSGNTAKPHTWVGGKTRRRHGGKHRCSKSCKHHKH
jgi:hypothetical protein